MTSDLRKLAHLQEQLGKILWIALLDPSNTGRVRGFCNKLLREMTIGVHTYKLVCGFRERREELRDDFLGEEDARYLLKHRKDIPRVFEERDGAFVFPKWKCPSDDEKVAYISFSGGWYHRWDRLNRGWGDNDYVLLRAESGTEDAASLPDKMTLGDVTYKILPFLKKGEKSITSDTMTSLAEDRIANLGEEDCRHLLEHQDQIPPPLQGEVFFIFPAWRTAPDSLSVACVRWDGRRWYQHWYRLDHIRSSLPRVLRRIDK